MIRRLTFVLLLSFLLVALFTQITWAAAASTNPTDVPSTHWSYQAVKSMIDKGYLQLYQDQTFQGDQPVDRYTLATVVAKILKEVATGQAPSSKDDLNLIKNLTNEYRGELVEALRKVTIFDTDVIELKKHDMINKEDTAKILDDQTALRKEAQQILDDLKATNNRVLVLEDENIRLKADLERMRVEAESTKKVQTIYLIIAIVLGAIGVIH